MPATFNKTDDILPTTQLHIATLNVNGIHNEKQNQWTTNNLKSRYYFLAKNTLNTWNCSEMEERMERKILWDSRTISEASAVAILSKEHFDIEIINSHRNQDGPEISIWYQIFSVIGKEETQALYTQLAYKH